MIEMKFKVASLRIEVSKSDRTLKLFDGRRLVKTYRCCVGRVAGDKQCEGDHKTPEGRFCVCYKNPVPSMRGRWA